MTPILRPYQTQAVLDIVRHLKGTSGAGGLAVLPTGSGKSLIIAAVARALQAPLLVYQPTKEILEQNLGKFRAYGIDPAVYSASMGRKETGEVVLATIGSVHRNADAFTEFPYILIDECHLVNSKEGMYARFLKQCEGSRIVGLTATPYRLSNDSYGGAILKFLTRTRPRVFDRVIHITQLQDLFAQGYLSPLVYTEIGAFDQAALIQNSTGTDFTDDSVRDYYKKEKVGDLLAWTVQVSLEKRRGGLLIFTRFVEDAADLALALPGKVAVVSADTPTGERAELIADFRRGAIPAMANVGILTTGFDYPELQTAIIARPTMSLALYYQMIGRIMRPHPDKEFGEVLDLCGNFKRFGRIQDLVVEDPTRTGQWVIRGSEGRTLTNTYFQETRMEVPANARASKCKGCSKRIFWLKTKDGKWSPFNNDGTRHPWNCMRKKEVSNGTYKSPWII